jgi:hypothetical protein
MAAEWLETAPDLGTRRARNHETNSNHCPAVGGDCCLCRSYRRHCALVHLAITKVCENSNIKSESMRLQTMSAEPSFGTSKSMADKTLL